MPDRVPHPAPSRPLVAASAVALVLLAAPPLALAQPAAEPAPPAEAIDTEEAAEETADAIDEVSEAIAEDAADNVAEEAKRQSDSITGVEKPQNNPGDTFRDVGSAMLFLPRQAVDFVYWSTSTAVGVVENEQVVPRAQRFVSADGGRIAVFPTAFIETGRPLNFGARMISDVGFAATSVRVGFGGLDSFAIEPRVAFHLTGPLRSVISAELLYQRDTDLDYIGLGQDPETDPRNSFLPGREGVDALYFERRVRVILGYALRVSEDIEVALSSSLNRRQIRDIDDPDTLSTVFQPRTVPGAFDETWILYNEVAMRIDTRPTRGRPSGGLRYEAYGGSARETQDAEVSFLRIGGRAAAFIPVARPTNILSSQIALDTLKPLSNVPVPFTELPTQPDFRGIDNRRDLVSVVGSIDYRWLLAESVGTRLFVDTALVAPEVVELDPSGTRWAAGLGFDIHSEENEIGNLALSFSPGGLRFLFSIGVSNGYGDRQHRD